ncbi:MAG: biotin/lipoyl-binding protein [Peptococcaceae bacterium]|nr:biotin/lipoyl-binding protein [Peptococcaceae bacterium]
MERLRITVNNKTYDVLVEVVEKDEKAPVQPLTAIEGGRSQGAKNAAPAAGGSTKPFCAPMPGTVMDIRVKKGDYVKEGDVLIVLEAMKMENELLADASGQVEEIHVARGQAVQSGDRLISLLG